MSEGKPRARRKSRRVEALPDSTSIPVRHTETWRSVTGEGLVEQVSGRPLEAGPFLAHLRRKLEELADA